MNLNMNHAHFAQRHLLAEMMKHLVVGGEVVIANDNLGYESHLVYRFADEPLPSTSDQQPVFAVQSGLFVGSMKSTKPHWLGFGSLDELHITLEGLAVGQGFLRRFKDGLLAPANASELLQSPGGRAIRVVALKDGEDAFSAAAHLGIGDIEESRDAPAAV